jgi:hypothetical protein
MKISDLADLVAVRNHISIVMGDKGVCSKDDVRPLNEARIKLDRKFVAALRDADVESLFSQPVIIHKENEAPQLLSPSDKVTIAQKVSQANEQLTLCLQEARDIIHAQPTEDSEAEDSEAADLALIAERVRSQKEQLKKEGRSNKRVSKAKEDGTDK